MKKIFIAVFLSAVSILLYRCSTDFSTIASYKETMVIYGLMDQNPAMTSQYIRISKAFLGEGNSLIMAQQKDSLYYANNVLDVKIQRIFNGSIMQTFQLQRTDTNLKDPGVFYNPGEILFRGDFPVLTDGSQYKLIVHNNQSGLTATSLTGIVGDMALSTTVNDPMNFTSNILTTIEFDAASNGWIYNYTLRFHYKELNLSSNDTTAKYVDWNFGDQVLGSTHPTTITYENIYRPDIYRIIGESITPVDTNSVRRIVDSGAIELIFTAGSEDLNTYLDLVGPSTGIIQERPLFSNIENAIGLFTSRSTRSYFRSMSTASLNALDTSAYTRNIHFLH